MLRVEIGSISTYNRAMSHCVFLTNKLRIPALLLLWLLPAPGVAQNAPDGPVDQLAIRLAPGDPGSPRTAFWLRIENLGKTTVRLIRPRQIMLEIYPQWGGWTLTVTGPGGRWEPVPETGIILLPVPADGIELKPWESVGVRVDIGTFFCVDAKKGAPFLRLVEQPGTYTLQVEYATPEHPFLRTFQPGVVSAEAPREEPFLTPIEGLRSAPFVFTN